MFSQGQYLFFISLVMGLSLPTLVSCSYDKTDIEVSSLFDPTWDFANSSELSFDQNYIEIINGKTQLKSVDLENSGTDFNIGTYSGSVATGDGLTINNDLDLTSTHVNAVLPARASDLVGYWRIENNWSDSSTTSADGSPVNSPLLTSDALLGEGAGVFDGVDQRVNIGTISALRPDKVSISAWVKISDNSPAAQFIAGYGSTGVEGYWLGFSSGGLFTFTGADGVTGGSAAQVRSTRVPLEGVWYHMVGTFEAGSSKLYVNGAFEFSKAAIVGNLSYAGLTDGFMVGNIQGLSSTRYLHGTVDEISVWNEVLTAEEIKTLYEKQSKNFTELSDDWTPHWDQIVGYWKMDGTWQDSSGNDHHGNPQFDTTFSEESKIGSLSATFDGVDDFLELPSGNLILPPATQQATISAWVYGTATSTDGRVLTFGNGGNSVFAILAGRLSDNFSAFCRDGANALVEINGDSGHPFLDSVWSHVLFTISDGVGYLYINGELANSASCATVQTFATTATTLKIGISANGLNNRFNGNIDDAAVWNVPLTASEVRRIYNRQKQKYAGHYDSKVFDLGSVDSKWPGLKWSTDLPFGKEIVGDFNSDGLAETETSVDYPLLTADFSDSLVSYWDLNEKSLDGLPSNFDFNDRSKNDHHLREINGVIIGRQGKLNSAVDFDGSDDYLISDPFTVGSLEALTVSAWVKNNESSPTGQGVFYKIGPSFELFLASSGSLIFYRNAGGWSGSAVSPAYSDWNEWHHVAVTYDGTAAIIYRDGVEVINHPDASGDVTDFNSQVRIGFSSAGGLTYWEGLIDDVAVWNRKLSGGEIQQLYRRGAGRIKFQVKSCIDFSCECKSYNVSPAGNSSDCDGDSVNNALDLDDIHKAQFLGPGGDGSSYYSELFNRDGGDFIFNCGINTSDSDSNICVGDEITFNGGVRPTSPVIDFNSFPLAAKPTENPYFQYRTYFEADENKACSGSPCLPTLRSIALNPDGLEKFYGGVREIQSTKGVNYKSIQSATITADSCTSFQLSPNNSDFYYWNGNAWALAVGLSQRTTKSDTESYIASFGDQFGPGKLYLKAFLQTNSAQTSSCSIQEIDINYLKQ